jgi:RAB protein geranylgeranyltransferase component A
MPRLAACSALARAGKSVLLLDASEWYGGAWASLPGPAFEELILTSSSGSSSDSSSGSSSGSGRSSTEAPPAAGAVAAPPPPTGPSDPLPAGCRFVPVGIPGPAAALSGATLHAAEAGGGGAFDRRCIVDLAPKVRR